MIKTLACRICTTSWSTFSNTKNKVAFCFTISLNFFGLIKWMGGINVANNIALSWSIGSTIVSSISTSCTMEGWWVVDASKLFFTFAPSNSLLSCWIFPLSSSGKSFFAVVSIMLDFSTGFIKFFYPMFSYFSLLFRLCGMLFLLHWWYRNICWQYVLMYGRLWGLIWCASAICSFTKVASFCSMIIKKLCAWFWYTLNLALVPNFAVGQPKVK